MNRYKLLIALLSFPVVLHAAWKAIQNKELRYFKQRLGLGYVPLKRNNASPIWIHAASVGEVSAAVHLINSLYENNAIILTTNTPSSAAHADKILSDKVTHYYCPVDWQWAIQQFIRKLQPQYLFVIETELWPNLFSVCNKKDIPIAIINGRISTRTLNAASWIKKRYRECLRATKTILTRSQEDSERFISLGAEPSIVKEIGNIKFYQTENTTDIAIFKTIRPYVLLASSRDDEETLIVEAWTKVKNNKLNDVSSLFIIVPRHPQRINIILSQLKRFDLNIAIRSNGDTITSETNVYIADTFGELISFIKGSQFVIMGGSFVNKGGQNILEVAQAGKTVVFGPFMNNFKEEAKLFVDSKAGVQLENSNELTDSIDSLLEQPATLQEMQENAIQLMQEQQTILEKYVSELKKHYPGIKFN